MSGFLPNGESDRYVNLDGIEVNIQGTPRTTEERCGKCGTFLYRSARYQDARCGNENCEDSATRSRPDR